MYGVEEGRGRCWGMEEIVGVLWFAGKILLSIIKGFIVGILGWGNSLITIVKWYQLFAEICLQTSRISTSPIQTK
jgi:hypothetical protein